MKRIVPIAVATAVIVSSGIIHGVWTARWNPSEALNLAAARVPLVPKNVGDWRGSEVDVEDANYRKAGAKEYWMRHYRNERTGENISVILMCGRAGEMSVHTPDVCYRGAGYEMHQKQRRHELVDDNGKSVGEFWHGDFVKGRIRSAPGLRLFWAWSSDGQWQAPEVPRIAFRGRPALYKLYVVRSTRSSGESLDGDSALRFLKQFLPEMNRALFSDDERGDE